MPNAGLSVDRVRRLLDDVPPRPKAPRPCAPVRAARSTFEGPQLPVTPTYADWSADGRGRRIGRESAPTATLSAAEIARGGPARRAEITRRHKDFVAHLSGASVADAAMTALSVERRGYNLNASASRVDACASDGRSVGVDLTDVANPKVDGSLELLLETFEAVLLSRRPPEAAKSLFRFLLAPGGVLNPQTAPRVEPADRFETPKLVCWDFNGTVERDRNLGFRPDVGLVTDNLNAMGAASVITTSIDPRAVEEMMVRANLRFNAYFGGPQVRPTPGAKQYAGVAAAYGLSRGEARHHMVTIGDSQTDRSGDLRGVVFINSDSDTPAELIQQLLVAMERAGGGSFARGLDALCPRPIDDRPQTIRVGDLAMEVSWPDDTRGPKVAKLRLERDASGVLRGLLSPASDDVASIAAYELNLRHVENQLDEQQLAEVVAGMDRVADPHALLASVELRAERRAEEIRVARLGADRIEEWLTEEPSAADVRAIVELVARAGDPRATEAMLRFAPRYAEVVAAREPIALAKLDERLAAAEKSLLAAIENAPRGRLKRTADRKAIAKIDKLVGKLPGSAEDLETHFAKLADKGVAPAVARHLEKVAKDWDKIVARARDAQHAHFAKLAALDVPALLDGSRSIARVRDATWQTIVDALATCERNAA